MVVKRSYDNSPASCPVNGDGQVLWAGTNETIRLNVIAADVMPGCKGGCITGELDISTHKLGNIRVLSSPPRRKNLQHGVPILKSILVLFPQSGRNILRLSRKLLSIHFRNLRAKHMGPPELGLVLLQRLPPRELPLTCVWIDIS
jgi:hypothetical protein